MSLPSHVMIKWSSRKKSTQCAKSGEENRTCKVCDIYNINLCLEIVLQTFIHEIINRIVILYYI